MTFAYKTVSPSDWVFPSATVRDSQLYIMSHPEVEGRKIGLAVNPKGRAVGVGNNMTVEMVTKRVHRDTMEAIEHLAQAYALVKYVSNQTCLAKSFRGVRSFSNAPTNKPRHLLLRHFGKPSG